MMPYALNYKKGTVIQNDDIGELPSGVAVRITERQANIAKHLINVVVFDRVAGIDENKIPKELYGLDVKNLVETQEELKTYNSFVKEFKDLKIAGSKWREYKKEKGMD